MAQHVVGNRLNIIGADIIAAGQPGVGAGAAVEGYGGARAGAVQRPVAQIIAVSGRVARRQHHMQQIVL